MYGHGRDQGEERLGAVPKSVVDRGDHQLSCSSSGGDVDAEMVIQGLVCSAFDFVPAFDVPQQPSRHSCVSDSLDGIRELQYCGQIKDTITR